MRIDWLESELFLYEDKPLRVTGACGVRVCCLKGTVWITTSGQADDIFLAAGQTHEIATASLTLIEGVGETLVRFDRAGVVRVTSGWWNYLGNELLTVVRESTALISRTGRVASERDSHA